MQKLYCYVDETGQDTQGALFLVALVIVGQEREKLRKLLRSLEGRSGKTTQRPRSSSTGWGDRSVTGRATRLFLGP